MLTKKQKIFYDSLRNAVTDLGYFPSVRELCRITGLSSTATIHMYLKKLTEKGMLMRVGGTFKFTDDGNTIPVVGLVPAGSPLEIFEGIGEEISVPEWMISPGKETFAFKVTGDSMKDAFIWEGDIVIIEREHSAESGEMVVALMKDEAEITLKRFRKKGANIWLEPENPDYDSITDPFEVVGKVVGVIRDYKGWAGVL